MNESLKTTNPESFKTKFEKNARLVSGLYYLITKVRPGAVKDDLLMEEIEDEETKMENLSGEYVAGYIKIDKAADKSDKIFENMRLLALQAGIFPRDITEDNLLSYYEIMNTEKDAAKAGISPETLRKIN